MPLWSNEEWRARIGSSWCVLGWCRAAQSSLGTLGFKTPPASLVGPLMLILLIFTSLCTLISTNFYNECLSLTIWCKSADGKHEGNFHRYKSRTTKRKIMLVILLLLQVTTVVHTCVLLRSGDIELNPGPRLYSDLDYNFVDGSTLSEDNVCDVCGEVMKLSAKYYKLGIVLGLPLSELEKIQQGFPQDMDRALIEVITRWLKHSYRVDMHGPPSWRKLVEAVDSKVGGDNHLLAKEIASRHPLAYYESSVDPPQRPQQLQEAKLKCEEQSMCSPSGGANGSLIKGCCETLAAFYLRQISDDRAWPLLRGDTFISLALIKDQTTWRKTIQKSVDEIVGDKQTISYTKMLEDIEECKFILLEGRPGSGKTTLMNQISRDWAKGKILNTKIVIFVPLRRLNEEADRTLSTILRISCPPLADSKLKQLASYIEECNGDDVVFAFDGLDEYVPCYRKVQTLEKEKPFFGFRKRENDFEDLFQLLYGNHLVKSLIIVTSRPAASKSVRQYARKRVEVVGFLEQQVTDYINYYFENDKEKAHCLEIHLKEHPNLMNMAYLPLHCAMLVSLYEEDTMLPNTESEFYKHFALSTLLRAQIREKLDDNVQLLSFDQLPHDDKIIFDNVCKLAFKATIASKQVLKSSEVDKTLQIADKKTRIACD